MTSTILVAHSDAAERARIASALQDQGCQTITAGDGDQALACFVADKPDLVLCASGLGELDGRRLARIIRSKEPQAAIALLLAPREKSDSDLPGLKQPFEISALRKLFPDILGPPLTGPVPRSAINASRGALQNNLRDSMDRAGEAAVQLHGLADEHRFVSGLVGGVAIGILASVIVAALWPEEPPEVPPPIIVHGSDQPVYKKALRAQLLASYRAKDYVESAQIGKLMEQGHIELGEKTLFTLGLAEHKAGLAEAAIAHFVEFADRFAANKRADDALFKAAELLRGQGNTQKARELFQRVADDSGSDLKKSAKQRIAEIDTSG